MKSLLFLLIFSIHSISFAACKYSFKKDSHQFTWTGYKFTNKKGVPGTFKQIGFAQKPSSSISDLIKSINFTIKTDTLDSGNPARDITLKSTVFNLLKIPGEIKGSVINVDTTSAIVELTLNEKSQIPFTLAYDKRAKAFEAHGQIDLLNNGLKPNFDAVHKSCEKLHTGEDKVSKTWSTVDLKITAQVVEECSFTDKIKKFFSKD